MSDTARPKSSGDKLSADEVNADLPIVLTGGETISGATTPAPVYIDSGDGELYLCDADDTDKLGFIGFVIDDSTDGNNATLQKDGIVSGFSGLTTGSKYYLSDTAGAISTTPGTNEVLVGIAVSATQLLIIQNGLRVASGAFTPPSGASDVTVTVGFRPRLIIIITKMSDGGNNSDVAAIGVYGDGHQHNLSSTGSFTWSDNNYIAENNGFSSTTSAMNVTNITETGFDVNSYNDQNIAGWSPRFFAIG